MRGTPSASVTSLMMRSTTLDIAMPGAASIDPQSKRIRRCPPPSGSSARNESPNPTLYIRIVTCRSRGAPVFFFSAVFFELGLFFSVVFFLPVMASTSAQIPKVRHLQHALLILFSRDIRHERVLHVAVPHVVMLTGKALLANLFAGRVAASVAHRLGDEIATGSVRRGDERASAAKGNAAEAPLHAMIGLRELRNHLDKQPPARRNAKDRVKALHLDLCARVKPQLVRVFLRVIMQSLRHI